MPASAVNSRFGRMRLLWLSPPETKSTASRRIEYSSARTWLVNLAQNDVITCQRCDHERRPPLCLAEVREGEVEDYNIAFYKFAQAVSSSGVSQSLASDDSAASAGIAVSAFTSLSDRRNASNLSRSCSGM